MTNTLHISIAAQSDNLGDVEIRRQLIEQFLQRGYHLVVFTGNMPQTYIDAFRLPSGAKVVSNPLAFQASVLRNALLGRASLAYAPGPHVLTDSPKALAKAAAVLGLCAFVRLRGGSLSVIGRSLRGTGRLSIGLERALSAMATSYAMRDTASAPVLGRSADVMPDMAFMRNASVDNSVAGQRDIVALSFRSDRAVNLDGLVSLIEASQARGLKPVFITQVRRDDEVHAELSKILGIDAVLWENRTHSEQEEVIEHYYSRSHAVVSNRLHSLLFGVAHQAFPVALHEENHNKIPTTLKPWVDFDSLVLDDPDFAFLSRTESDRKVLSDSAKAAGTVLGKYISSKVPDHS
ncbi:conserved hypothetical protein [Arthrobacter sp. 9V]|uniref:hypothetical protein n=1 Tax=Arthrobacter sp. 9V TaxID=2653132 RepID=UPI0012F1D2BF|nr:hypothetical protein [Arthrobacter sp. 9V]VXC66545.1 conserved hypothetical protein [Arthrobacter sp. 9V]